MTKGRIFASGSNELEVLHIKEETQGRRFSIFTESGIIISGGAVLGGFYHEEGDALEDAAETWKTRGEVIFA